MVRACSAATRGLVYGLLVIDVGGLSIPALTRNLAVVRYASRCGLAYFPEGTDRVLVVNAPRLAAAMWKLVAPLLPEGTRRKVRIGTHHFTLGTTANARHA